MKRFLWRSSLFVSIQFAIGLILIANHCQQKNYGYMASFEDKLQLLKQHQHPSVILLGGSNVAFGVDSEELQLKTGRPVINAGLHSALGLNFYLDIADRYVRKGDIVILIPEWDLLAGNFQPRELQLQQLLRESPTAWDLYLQSNSFRPKSFLDHLALPEFAYVVQNGLKFRSEQGENEMIQAATATGSYSRLNFNSHGDFVGHHGLGTVKKIEDLSCTLMFHHRNYQIAVEKLHQLSDSLRNRGASLYLAYAPLPETFFQKFEKDIINGHRFLASNLEIPILHPPNETNYPSHLFYDTVYHLNRNGKNKRTRLLAQSLNQQLRLANLELNPR